MSESFGQLLGRLRLRADLSQNQLARLGGCDPAYVNRLENERTSASRGETHAPRRLVVLRLAAALGCSLVETDELLIAVGLLPLSIVRLDPQQRHALLLALDAPGLIDATDSINPGARMGGNGRI